MKTDNIIEIGTPRETVEIYLPDGRTYRGKRGLPIIEFMQALPEWKNPPIVGAVVDGELRELTFLIKKDSYVKPVTMSDSDGSKIYRRSLVFLLQASFEDVFPRLELTVDYSVPSGGYVCKVKNHAPLNEQAVKRIEKRMREIVAQDLPIKKELVELDEAKAYFAKRNMPINCSF